MNRLRFPKPLLHSMKAEIKDFLGREQSLEAGRSPVPAVGADADGPEDVRLGINTLKAVMEAMAAGR
jgi:hypothetical protein